MGRILTEKEMESVRITPDAIKAEMQQLSEKNTNKKVTAEIANDWTNFDKYLIDLSQDVKEPQQLVSVSDKPIFTRGNISCVSGKAKSRKTFLIGLFASQFLEHATTEKVIIFDTEQGTFHAQKSAKRIHRLLEWSENENNEKLRVFKLRELKTEERKEFVVNAIRHYKPDIVIIDGIRDLAKTINNEEEATEVTGLLMNLSSVNNCHICCVLHENKADNSLRGHLGTELQNKSETVISVEADGSVSAVSPKYCRDIPFETFHFRINENGLPEHCEPEMKPKNEGKLKELFNDILPATASLNYADLTNKVMAKCSIQKRGAEKKIKSAIEQDIIAKNKAGLYYSGDLNINTNTENSLPF